jgi:hypothetical protein
MQDWRAKLGRNVRRLRHPRGLTQEQLAFEAESDLTYVGGNGRLGQASRPAPLPKRKNRLPHVKDHLSRARSRMAAYIAHRNVA